MMELVADSMLSKLARWLRLGGISVEGVPYNEDDKIIRFVKRKKALLLTSDEQLAKRSNKRGFNALLVKEKDLDSQIAFVISALGLKPTMPGMVCPVCNGRLVKVSKEEAKRLVPKRAYEMHKIFYRCKSCGKIYWHGTHWKKIKERYKKVVKLADKFKSSRNWTSKLLQ
jgi:uncharacterized protein with PIN domain